MFYIITLRTYAITHLRTHARTHLRTLYVISVKIFISNNKFYVFMLRPFTLCSRLFALFSGHEYTHEYTDCLIHCVITAGAGAGTVARCHLFYL